MEETSTPFGSLGVPSSKDLSGMVHSSEWRDSQERCERCEWKSLTIGIPWESHGTWPPRPLFSLVSYRFEVSFTNWCWLDLNVGMILELGMAFPPSPYHPRLPGSQLHKLLPTWSFKSLQFAAVHPERESLQTLFPWGPETYVTESSMSMITLSRKKSLGCMQLCTYWKSSGRLQSNIEEIQHGFTCRCVHCVSCSETKSNTPSKNCRRYAFVWTCVGFGRSRLRPWERNPRPALQVLLSGGTSGLHPSFPHLLRISFFSWPTWGT